MKAFTKSKAGFSLAELVIAMTIASFVLTASYATVISLAKGSQSMINFSEMNNQTRYAIEVFGRDSRMASNVIAAETTTFTSRNSLWDETTKAYRDYEVTYKFISSAGTFKRTVYDVASGALVEDRILLYDVQDLKFTYYSLINQSNPLVSPETTRLLEIKHVQVEAELQREVLNVTNTNYIISARFMLRNKDVSS
ncbi:prepilin-type N-terminal cleavage/methylation domain-containing protein [Puniceicoccales bacterium CK1056]|uniref:Prepilin-type N-terminal cleavage/methylation domain-containing protein n=1 Tax=Oceanipulchritudo coccoides TaxID=2706888 RepID=A0A6B2M4E7_9BACT|nr:prepilin-type N-terminal cleavage/methylation domain-containing protein [Oceanipulchritudo coccoides]NDV62957.1 prepilin-type N-terminal cleavage/methylation domain-containing protein [Oceanipulchritudo coccoides]